MKSNGTLIFHLFTGFEGVGFYNQIFSLELAIYMSYFFNRDLYIYIKYPLAAMGKYTWDYGNIFDYINDISPLLNTHDYKIINQSELSELKRKNVETVHTERMSISYYVDKCYRNEKHKSDIDEFSHGRIDISKKLDVMFDETKPYVEYTNSNASRFFSNFYTTHENKLKMAEIASFFISYKPHIELLFSSIELPEEYIAIHFRLGDVPSARSRNHQSTTIIMNNILPWLRSNNPGNLPLLIMSDKYPHEALNQLEREFKVLYTNKLFDETSLSSYHKDTSVANFLVEKKICDNATHFIGTQTSTVSVHVNYARYTNNKSHTLYCNVVNSNFDKNTLSYKIMDPSKKYTWGKYNYGKQHLLSWTLFFPDNIVVAPHD
jgi:hypothetical protein